MTRKTLLTSLSILLLTASVSFAADEVTFGSAALQPGDSWSDTATYSSNVTLNGSAQEQNTSRTKETSVSDVGGDGSIDAAVVTYSAASRNGAPLPVTGHSYAIAASGNSVDVSYAGGGTPSEGEIAFVRSDNAHFRQMRAYDRIFGGKKFTVGSTAQVNRNDAAELVNAGDGVNVSAFALTLRSVRTENGVEIATFDVSMTLNTGIKHGHGKGAAAAPAGGMVITLDGTLDVQVSNARPALLDVTGPVGVQLRKPSNALFAEGNGGASLRIEYF